MTGYTHRISFKVLRKEGALAGMRLPGHFNTTADAVALSLRNLRARPDVSDVQVTDLRVEE